MITSCFLSLYTDHLFFSFFFFNDTATTEIYTLSLHDALPISRTAREGLPPWPERKDCRRTTLPPSRETSCPYCKRRDREPQAALGKDNDRRRRMSRRPQRPNNFGRGAPGRRAADASFLVSGVDAPRWPSVDGDADSGDDRGARRGQEAHDVGDVLGRRDAAELVGRLGGRAHLVDRLPRRLRLLLHRSEERRVGKECR